MLKTLNRKLKHRLYRHDYALMLHLAATGDYVGAARLALMLGETELHDQYAAQAARQTVLRYSRPVVFNVYRRCALEHEMKQRCN